MHCSKMAEPIIYIDFKSPAAYLAWKPTMALLAEQSVSATWLPAQTRQRPIAPQKAEESKTDTHFRVREIARQSMHLHYAEVQGIPMKFREKPGDTDLALAAMLYAGAAGETLLINFIENAFRAYWEMQQDLNDAQQVEQLLEQSGLPADLFDAEAWLARLAETAAQALDHGAIDAPAYIIGEQLFIGREHLPWIKALLQGSADTL